MPEILQMPVFSILMTLSIFIIVSGQSPVPDDVIVEKLADGFQFLEGPHSPNDIAVRSDGSIFFTDPPFYVWDVAADSIFTNKRKFASISPPGYIDGMKVDVEGNLYCAGPIGVWIFSPDGTLIDTIEVPGQTTNINWGDANRKSLYVTSGDGIYRIQLNI
jgi:sugar lactone lactonase YvrE